MKLLKITLSVFFLFCFGLANAQDDLMNELNATKSDKKEISSAAFKGLQVANMQSTKLPAKGEFYFLVSHRFGDLTDGINNFYGLDAATTKFGGIYGVTNWLSLGVARVKNNKTFEFTAKYKFANQMDGGFPVTIVGYNTMDIRTDLKTDAYPDLKIKGTVASLSEATGAKFALLPPDNASGNFVKVTQRLPVKIWIDDVAKYKKELRAGLSVNVVAEIK